MSPKADGRAIDQVTQAQRNLAIPVKLTGQSLRMTLYPEFFTGR